LARLAQTLVGSYKSNQIRQNYQNQATDYRTQLAQALAGNDPMKALSQSSNPELQQEGLQLQMQRAARAPQEQWRPMTPQEVQQRGLNPRGSYETSNFGQTRVVQVPVQPTVQDGFVIDPNDPTHPQQIPGWVQQHAAIAAAGRAPVLPPDAVREFQFAKSQGFNGSYTDYLAAKGQASSGIFGGGDNGKALTILTRGDPSSPEYASAYWLLSQPKMTVDQQTGQMTTVTPDMSKFRPPAGTQLQGAPQGAAAPQQPPSPAVGGNQATPGQPGGQPTLQAPIAPPASPAAQPGVTITPIPGAQGRIPNDEQSKAGGFYDRMTASEANISSNAAAGTSRTQQILNAVPGIGNSLISGAKQSLNQAELDWLTAQLRRESGAVIGPSEIENAKQQYFPQPGDSDETLAQKAANRQTAMDAMKKSAGPYYKFAPPKDTNKNKVLKYNPARGKLE
jgi:hypothetical protein